MPARHPVCAILVGLACFAVSVDVHAQTPAAPAVDGQPRYRVAHVMVESSLFRAATEADVPVSVMAEVTHMLPVLRMPRIVMQECEASITTATPVTSSSSINKLAIVSVIRS